MLLFGRHDRTDTYPAGTEQNNASRNPVESILYEDNVEREAYAQRAPGKKREQEREVVFANWLLMMLLATIDAPDGQHSERNGREEEKGFLLRHAEDGMPDSFDGHLVWSVVNSLHGP